MHRALECLIVTMYLHAGALVAAVPAAVYTDPVADPKSPASMVVLHIPTHDVKLNGIAYLPTGAGPHPVVVICHGLPGNEKNLDLAQAVRRAGWIAVTFNYRGSWGSPGTFSFSGNLEDAAAVLDFLRQPDVAASLRLDPKRIVLVGHSMGGWVTAKVAARDSALIGAALISAADIGSMAAVPHAKLASLMADDMESLAGVTADSMASEVEAHGLEYSMLAAADGLRNLPLLVLSSDDGLAPHSDSLVAAIRANGGTHVTSHHVATDHGWSDHRIALESAVLHWLQTLH